MKITFFIISFSITLFCFGQNKSQTYEENLLDKAYTIENVLGYTSLNILIKEKDSIKSNFAKETKRQILSNAEEYYDKLIDSFPNSKLIYKAIIGKAYIKYEIGEYQNAKKEFLKIYNTRDSLNFSSNNSEMSARFWVAIHLAEIAVMDKEYNAALVYLESSKNYTIRYMCLNGYYQDQAKYKYLMAKSYIGLNDYEKAYSILIPNLFEPGCLSDAGIIELAIESLQKKHSKSELKSLYEKAFKNYQVEIDESRKKPITRFYILFLNEKIYLPYYEDKNTDKKDRQESIDKVLAKSKFYQKLNS
ncbi:tetratricopeptide repeat protein [Flavobacterium sp.]|uniref:tetratricopeptide repeat protein n=1 Tax=Flavobacterium sp. TaxID=239 RepID=UPI0039E65F41